MTRRQLVLLLATSYIARVPVTAIPLGLVLVARADGHAYDVAGLLAGAYTLALAITSPILGGLADRFGAPRVFLAGAPTCAAALAAIGIGAAGPSTIALVALAIVAGAALPPLGALTRGLLTPQLSAARQARIFSIDATAQELCFIAGPVLLALVVSLTSARHALVVLGAFQVVGAVVFWSAGRRLVVARAHDSERARSPLTSAALRTVLAIAIAAGMLFGAFELSITAAVDAAGHRSRAGILLGVWSVGSLIGGAMNVRWPMADARRRLTWSLMLSVATAALVAAVAGQPFVLAAALVIAGVVQAPLMACCYVLVPQLVRGRASEAFGWLTSAVVGGIALGAASAGAIVDRDGAPAGFVVAVAASLGGLALVRGALWRATRMR